MTIHTHIVSKSYLSHCEAQGDQTWELKHLGGRCVTTQKEVTLPHFGILWLYNCVRAKLHQVWSADESLVERVL